MTGADAATAAVAELSRLFADALGSVGAGANVAVRELFQRKVTERDFTYRPEELAQAVERAVHAWSAELCKRPEPSPVDGSDGSENQPTKTG